MLVDCCLLRTICYTLACYMLAVLPAICYLPFYACCLLFYAYCLLPPACFLLPIA